MTNYSTEEERQKFEPQPEDYATHGIGADAYPVVIKSVSASGLTIKTRALVKSDNEWTENTNAPLRSFRRYADANSPTGFTYYGTGKIGHLSLGVVRDHRDPSF